MSIHEMYDEVIDESGHVKLCGHEACKRLIKAMEKLFPGEDFGDRKTGFVNRKNLIAYYNEYKSEF